MTTKLVFVELDARALDYVREQLTGVNQLCTALLEIFATTDGKVFTLVPAGTPPERLHRFDEGGFAGAESLVIEQAAYLASMVREAPAAACIVDDFEPSWIGGDYHDDSQVFGVEDEVYRLLTNDDPPDAFINALRLSNNGWHGVAAVCAEAPELEEDRATSPAALQTAAFSVAAITCIAYEGEGFVVWRRTS